MLIMLSFLKFVLFCICLFSCMAAAYGFGLKSESLVLNSLLLALPCSLALTFLAYFKGQ
ncbi:hypothetical protein S144_5 [Shewanella sp. phage 1/44]|uniref:hypothetical protein n=1 Tax=Shewanella sp. phage 1/44 TaxID=1458862 RepID=UPI0004F73487|nr:hypothetical protein S144_5 [Shewanella sp. phage 1/44]AHK11720.1 hypothetical protein S144_5 [Shewanella sp. phage 1/44]